LPAPKPDGTPDAPLRLGRVSRFEDAIMRSVQIRQESSGLPLPLRKLSSAWQNHPIRLVVLLGLGALALITTALLLFRQPFPLSAQPFPDAHEYLNAAYRLAHGHGYTTTVRDNPYSSHARQVVNPPRFPPGTSLLLAPFGLLGSYPGNIEFGARLLAVALVIATGWAAYSLAGWYAALLAVVIAATSQFVLLNTQIVMSDVLAATLVVLCVPLLRLRASWSTFLLGFVAGYSVAIRESGIVVLVSLLIVVSGWNRLRLIAGALPPVLGLAIYNWTTFGAPWRSGYGYWLGPFREYSLSYVLKHPWPPGGEESYYVRSLHFFHLARFTHAGVIGLLPNLWFYPLMILGFSAIFGPPWLSLVGLVGAARWWRQREAQFTLLLTVLTVLVYMPNFTQDPRFVAGPCYVLIAWGLAALVYIARRMRQQHSQQIYDFFARVPHARPGP
jgi:hypothetical protein